MKLYCRIEYAHRACRPGLPVRRNAMEGGREMRGNRVDAKASEVRDLLTLMYLRIPGLTINK